MPEKRRRVVLESSGSESDDLHLKLPRHACSATTPRVQKENNEVILQSEVSHSLPTFNLPSMSFSGKSEDTGGLVRADQLPDLNTTVTSISEDKEQESDTEMAPGDMEDETQLDTTVEYVAQLPSPRPHSVFVLKGLDKKKKTLILPAIISLINGELYNTAAKPPAPLHLQLLQPPSTHRLNFADTPAHLVRLLESHPAEQHSQLGFKAPSTGDKASDVTRFRGERLYLAAKAWGNHTVNSQANQSALRVLGHLLHHDDHALFTIICKSFQREWTALVQDESFMCGGACGQTRSFDVTRYTFELVLERAAVVAVARQALEDGVRVSGFKVLKLLASPNSGNVVLSCQHCPNVCKGTISSSQQAEILAKIRL